MRNNRLAAVVTVIISIVAVLAYHGLTSAATVNEKQVFNKEVVFRGASNVFQKSLRVGQGLRGGVTFITGTIVNDSVVNGENRPVTIGDNLRVDGAIERGGVGGEEPIKVADSIIPTRTNVYSLGSEDFRFQHGYFSGTLDADTLTIAHIGSSDVIATNNIIGSAVTSAKILDSTIATGDLADDAVTGEKIASATISGGNLAAGTVTGSNLATGTVTSANILDNTITGSDILTTTDITANDLTASGQIGANGAAVNSLYGINSISSAADSRGVNATNTSSTGTTNYAGYFSSSATSTNSVGVFGEATGAATTNIGVYGVASGAGTNLAGYFVGAVSVEGDTTVTGTLDQNGRITITQTLSTGQYGINQVTMGAAGAAITGYFVDFNPGAMDGADDVQSGITIAVSNADHSNGTLYGLNIPAITGDVDATEYGIFVGAGYDVAGYFAVSNATDSDWIADFANNGTNATSDGLRVTINVATPGNANNYIQFDKNGGTAGNIDGDGVGGVRYNTSGADFAEYFPTAEELSGGTLVSLGQDGKMHAASSGDNLFGVVSSGGAFVGNTNYSGDSADVLIALMGQVPVSVNNEGGAILPGDKITVSSQAGVGRKAKDGEPFVGIALESFSDKSGQVKVLVSVMESY